MNAMLENILPVSARAEGLAHDAAVGKHLAPASLGSIRALLNPSTSLIIYLVCDIVDNDNAMRASVVA